MFLKLLKEASAITAFASVMMLSVEYLDARTRGSIARSLKGSSGWKQCAIAAVLGMTPGCFGAFVVVALYSHRIVSVGAVVACMTATIGDETFIMLSLFPEITIVMIPCLAALGIVMGIATDRALKGQIEALGASKCDFRESHLPCNCEFLSIRNVLKFDVRRETMLLGLIIIAVAVIVSWAGPDAWGWERAVILLVIFFAFIIVASVSDQFLREHLWKHVAIGHAPRIFVWTLSAFVIVNLIADRIDLMHVTNTERWGTLMASAGIGVIPMSGPHMTLATLFDEGKIGLAAVISNSIIQDGHGMIPMLACSKRTFVIVKAIKVGVGVAAGAALMMIEI